MTVHEGKRQQITPSLGKGTKPTNALIEDLSINKFNENHDPLEVNHVASDHEESREAKTENGPIVTFMFCGINHVKPIQLTKIGSSVHEERKPYNCSFCYANFLSKEHVNEHISILHEMNENSDGFSEIIVSIMCYPCFPLTVITFICSLCNVKVFNKKDLKAHIASVHL